MQVDPSCPNFTSSFNGVEFFVKTEFNVLNVLLHREGITTFQNFILDLVERYFNLQCIVISIKIRFAIYLLHLLMDVRKNSEKTES